MHKKSSDCNLCGCKTCGMAIGEGFAQIAHLAISLDIKIAKCVFKVTSGDALQTKRGMFQELSSHPLDVLSKVKIEMWELFKEQGLHGRYKLSGTQILKWAFLKFIGLTWGKEMGVFFFYI